SYYYNLMNKEQKRLILYTSLIAFIVTLLIFGYIVIEGNPVNEDATKDIAVSVTQEDEILDDSLLRVLEINGLTEFKSLLETTPIIEDIQTAEQQITLFIPSD